MRVAIVHYHLRTGGVTRIIQHTCSVLAARGAQTLILTGDLPASSWNVPIRAVRGLGYEGHGLVASGRELAAELLAATRDIFGTVPDLWHVHNHTLGKSLVLPQALHALADEGHRLLLQIHDFPEDGRPLNYQRQLEHIGSGDRDRLSAILYPQAPHVHYAVLNGRDFAFLHTAGVVQEQLHLLPNPVQIHSAPSTKSADIEFPHGRLWLYSTRAIRRKNLGEFLLWAALAESEEMFATTQGPKNPLERPAYDRWRRLAEELRLAVQFEIGTVSHADFEKLICSAYALVTTSVAEGFGLAFLEPWLAGRAVTGRKLTEITAGFEQVGVNFPGLYERVDVPVHWLGYRTLKDRVWQGLTRVMAAYGRTPKADDLSRVLSAWIHDGCVDFGRLDEPLQEAIIRRVTNSSTARDQLLPHRLPDPGRHTEQIEGNRRVIAREFSLTQYGERLLGIYHQIIRSPVKPLEAFSGEALLDQFLAPERLYLLRS
jgi:glycosyltransferase involved in cell wall biosynthesis